VEPSQKQTISLDILKCVEDHFYRYDRTEYEAAYLVIKGLQNTGAIQQTENRFVVTARNLPQLRVYDLYEGQFTNLISPQSAFGNTEYWVLQFDKDRLIDHILSIKLRAHPRSGRIMNLRLRDPRNFNPYCHEVHDYYNPYCNKGLTIPEFSCKVDDDNKGYCLLNFQKCSLSFLEIYQRVYWLEATFQPKFSFGLENTTDEVHSPYAYSITYNLVPQNSDEIQLDETKIIPLETREYRHYYTNIPEENSAFNSNGGYFFVIEAYFESNNEYMQSNSSITIYVNDPIVDNQAGLPQLTNGCLCNKNRGPQRVTGTDKVVYLVPRCQVLSGTYKWSIWTDSHHYREGKSWVTVKPYLIPFVRPLDFDVLTDFNLFAGQSIAFKVSIDPDIITSNTRTDKELRTIVSSHKDQYGTDPTYYISNGIGNCECGAGNETVYTCTNTAVPRECFLDLGFCQLAPGGDWYIIVSRGGGNDAKQIAPYTVITTKKNKHETVVGPVSTAPRCNHTDRVAAGTVGQTDALPTTELIYYSVPAATGAGVFSAYLENITGDNVAMFFGNGYLPSPNPGCADRITVCPENTQEKCILSTSCPVTFIGLKATSNIRNRPATYRLTTCYVPAVSQLKVNDPPKSVTAGGNDKVDIPTSLAGMVRESFPMLVINVNLITLPVTQYSFSFVQSVCGTCPRSANFSQSCAAGQNCSLYVPVCNLPDDFASSLWTLTVNNPQGITKDFSIQVKAVNLPNPTNTPTNSNTTITAGSQNWIYASWTLASPQVIDPSKGYQTSYMQYTATTALSGPVFFFYVPANGEEGDCPFNISANPYPIQSCCTQPGLHRFAFFNTGFNSVDYKFEPYLITQSDHTVFASAWTVDTPVSQAVSVPQRDTASGRTTYIEYYVKVPMHIPAFSTIAIQVFMTNQNSGVSLFLNRNTPAGPVGTKGGCFGTFASPVIASGNSTTPLFMCKDDVQRLNQQGVDPFGLC